MTLIECFTDSRIGNIAACLGLRQLFIGHQFLLDNNRI